MRVRFAVFPAFTFGAAAALGLLIAPAAHAGLPSGPPSPVFAQAAPAASAKPKKPKAEPKAELPPGTLEKLHSGDPAKVREALDDVRVAGAGARGAAPVLVELLEKGLPADLTIAAIDTLGDLEAEGASGVLAWYADHRSAGVRQSAVKALVRTKGPDAVRALRHALSDADPAVRGTAASGLGALKAHDAVPDLFRALDHRVSEAAAALGELCTPTECASLMGRLEKIPFDVMTGGLEQMLFRPVAEVSDDDKVKIVGRIRELGTPEANRFLRDVQKRAPATWSPRLKQAIAQAVMATGGGT